MGSYYVVFPLRAGTPVDIGEATAPFGTVHAQVISAGSISVSSAITGPVVLTGTLGVTGAVSLSSTITALGAATAPSFKLSDGSDKNLTLSVLAAGTAYTLTNTSALAAFGTTSPSLTLTAAGTYLLMSRFNLEYNGATFAANRTVTMKLRRTNNTAADVTNSISAMGTNIVTTVSGVMVAGMLPPTVYTTANTSDIISLFADVGTVPSAGSLQVTEANIVAVRLY